MTEQTFEITEYDNATVFKITRPKRLNAITSSVLDGLSQVVEDLETQSGNRGLIIIGEGNRAFCAGTDLFERDGLSAQQNEAKSDRARDLLVRIHSAPFISIAALNGLAFGGGLEIALACLFRISAAHAECSLPEVKIGLIPAYAGTQLLPATIGRARALDMMLTGRAVPSEEALQIGLINRIADGDRPLLDQAIEYLNSICQYSKVAINGIRRSTAAFESSVNKQGLAAEKTQVLKVGKSEDAAEGVAAFREKRAAKFKHR